ncbi:angiopoietin-related protein 1-like [Ptychodera flava]|uniref:angiopoietin-related protein 1-like n=1 Tax=Ptychodera flava TaxID=63121 RepID=UPI00396A794D
MCSKAFLCCLAVAACFLTLATGAEIAADGHSSNSNDNDACYYTFVVPGTEECMASNERLQVLERKADLQEKQLQELNTLLLVALTTCESDGSPIKPRLYDCNSAQDTINSGNGVYLLRPEGLHSGFHAYCEISSGEAWTVIQRRIDGTVDFQRDWESYKHGFGSWRGEYWLGNENIYHLTNQGDYKLRVELQDWNGNMAFAEYGEFWLDSESEKYRLHVELYTGSAGDSLGYHDGIGFSTSDKDNDSRDRGSCQTMCKGGWWYKDCYNSNLNGVYRKKGPYSREEWDGLDWGGWRGYHYSLKKITMKIKRK